MRMRGWTLVVVALGWSGQAGLRAEVSLPALFTDHMVLQQGRSNPIWGWASPGEVVQVEIAGQRQTTAADATGRWRSWINPMEAGGPYTLSVRGRNLVQVEDILVGEVWLAAGQSNMQFAVAGANRAVEVLSGSSCPDIRLFQVARHSSLEPAEHTPSRWQTCSPATVAGFSAVAYFFGRQLQQQLRVPVGLINASWGGTNAEEWTRQLELESDPAFGPILERWRSVDPATRALFLEDAELELWLDDLEFLPIDGRRPSLILDDFEDGDLQTSLFGRWQAGRPGPWGEGRLEPDESGSLRYTSRIRPGEIAQVTVHFAPGTYIDLSRYEALRFRCRGTGRLRFQSLQPDIGDSDNYTAPVVELTPGWQSVTIRFQELAQAGWGKSRPFTAHRLSGAAFEVLPPAPFARPPAGLYNGMIHPLVPFGVRGVLWYQGEGNAGRSYQYRRLLPAMVASWRSAWEVPELPFLVVQLPNFRARRAEPSESGWAELREAQLMTARTDPWVHLAVTIELGEDDDVHPKEKQEVGRRLAVLAGARVYGRDLVGSGPLYHSFRREGSAIRIEFTEIGSGLISAGGNPVRGFAVAGEDRRFHWAEARIDGASVLVSSPAVSDPVAVRYGWADNPDCSLYNAEGLPASPFRTDDWPGVTADTR